LAAAGNVAQPDVAAQDLAAPLPTTCLASFTDEPRLCVNMTRMASPPITKELDFLETPLPPAHVLIVEAGCGAAYLAREQVSRHTR
jgi:hypothetical protein